ncbi:MAG TPA: hypothetical protein PKU76_03810 [Candidatus Cloacimonas sp.]|nr:hypothetical protein [Candidatus Cloacimonas sp.]
MSSSFNLVDREFNLPEKRRPRRLKPPEKRHNQFPFIIRENKYRKQLK